MQRFLKGVPQVRILKRRFYCRLAEEWFHVKMP